MHTAYVVLAILQAILVWHANVSTASLATDLCGSDQAWRYSPLAGSCFVLLAAAGPQNQSSAGKLCANLPTGVSYTGVRLPQPISAAEIDGLRLVLNELGFGANQIWLGAGNASGTFVWFNESTPIASSLWLSGSGGTGSCVSYKSQLTASATAMWTQQSGLAVADCGDQFAVVCEKPVPKCNAGAIVGYNQGTMRAKNVTNSHHYYNLFNIGLVATLDCLPGFYRERDSPSAATAVTPTAGNGVPVNTMQCSYANVSASAYWSPVVLQGYVEECFPIRCATEKLKTSFRIPNVKPYDSEIAAPHFNYSQKFYVTCSRGYVSYRNQSAVTSPVECGQSYMDPTQGEWVPFDLNTCQPVKCPDISGVINTDQAVAYKAENRITQQQYTEFQSSSYPYYPNRVYVKCAQAGYFFDDRNFEKTIGCDLLNASLIEGTWVGVLGTKVSLLKSAQCIEVSCSTDTLIPKTAAGQAKLQSLNYHPQASIAYANGTTAILNASRVNEQELLPYKTVLTFRCQEGMDTGTGQPISLCRSSGDWNLSTLPTCTKVSDKLDTRGKFYIPPAVEAAAAGSVGALAITISVVFGISLLMLDLSTLSRDVALMKRNLLQLRHRIRILRRKVSA